MAKQNQNQTQGTLKAKTSRIYISRENTRSLKLINAAYGHKSIDETIKYVLKEYFKTHTIEV